MALLKKLTLFFWKPAAGRLLSGLSLILLCCCKGATLLSYWIFFFPKNLIPFSDIFQVFPFAHMVSHPKMCSVLILCSLLRTLCWQSKYRELKNLLLLSNLNHLSVGPIWQTFVMLYYVQRQKIAREVLSLKYSEKCLHCMDLVIFLPTKIYKLKLYYLSMCCLLCS